MKKTILIACCLFSMTAATAQTKVSDKQKRNQILSMETTQWNFSPSGYYWWFHNSYSGAYTKWQWSGLSSGWTVKFKESDSDTKRIYPTRVESELLLEEREEDVNEEDAYIEELYEEELILEADRCVDLMYSSYKDDFEDMQDAIAEGLTYCLTKSKGKLASKVADLTNQNDVICEMIEETHKTGLGYQVENAKRQRTYEEMKSEMESLKEEVVRLALYAELTY